MSIRPHPTKHRRYKNETWWIVDIGRGKDRQQLPFQGSFETAKNFEKDIRQGSNKVVSVTPKIKDLILPFLSWYKNEASPRTIEDIRFTIDLYLIPHFGNLRPGQLTVSRFDEFKEALLDHGLSPTTINKHLNYISSILNWASTHDHCRELTFRIPRFPKKKTTAEPVKPLTARQLDALYKQIQPQYRLLFLLMADMGLRKEEAMNLMVEDVDEHHQAIRVKGKGHKYRRVPYMSDRFEVELSKVLDAKLEGYLNINPKTDKPYLAIWKELKRATKDAGITRKVNHHLLRHTFATLAAERGINPHALQRILGHSSIETTNKIYTNVSLDFVGNEVRKLRSKN